MKTTTNLLLAGILAIFFSSQANAQIIYSNAFNGGATNIYGTAPNTAASLFGGTNIATWTDVLGTNDTGALLANGVNTVTNLGDSFLLPFTPQSGHVYLLTTTVNFTNNPNNWLGVGFALNNTTNVASGYARFSDNQTGGTNSPRGYDWMIIAESTGNAQYFAGAGAATTLYSGNNAFTPGFYTNTVSILLNTITSPWSIDSYINGVQLGTNYTYASNPTIRGVGLTINAMTAPTAVQFDNFTFSAPSQPFIVRQPATNNVATGSAFTNSVLAIQATNGGTLSYQWYANGLPLSNGGSISGATSTNLVITSIATNNAGSYYVIAANSFGTATSSVANVSVFQKTLITSATPISYTNPITLFGGATISGTNYLGSSPTFSLVAAGAQPLTYFWLTNGVVLAGANQSSLTFTNCQISGPTNFTCVVSNSYGAVSNTWLVSYVPTPVAAYPQSVLAATPTAFWRLNETSGIIADDYQSANNGIYTNVSLGQQGYNSAEPAETSAEFGPGNYSYVGQIQDVDFAATNGANAEYTVEAWSLCVSGGGTVGGAPVITKGTNGVNDTFFLGVDTNASTQNYEFYVRTANGTVYKADSSVQATDLNWHHLVGVCDEANGTVSLYIDGGLAAATSIPTNSGAYEVAAPISIGAGIKSGSTTYNSQFTGYIADVAVYGHALSATAVAKQYIAVSGGLAPTFAQTPPASVTVNAGATLTIPASLIGSAPLGYYWTDVNAGTNVAAGSTNGLVLGATLVASNVPTSWNNDQLEITATNATGSTNYYVTVTVSSGAPQIVTNVQTSFGTILGGTASNSVAVSGSAPFTYQWQFNGTNLSNNGRISGAQGSLLSISDAQLIDVGSYQVIIANAYNAITSSVAMMFIENDLPIQFNNNGLGWATNTEGTYTTPFLTNGLLTLTDNHGDQARAYFFDYPVYIGAFKASFTYQASGTADGATFCIQDDPRGAAAIGGIGGQLGVGLNGSQQPIVPSVELELNIYSGNGVGGTGYSFTTNGAVGATTAPGTVGLIGAPIDITLNYANGKLAMTFSNETTAVTYSTNFAVLNLPQFLGTNTAYVGFTGSTGGSTATQTVTNFTFASIPTAAIQDEGTNVLISWPGIITGYTLQETTNLLAPNWVTMPVQGSLTNNLYEATVPLGGASEFYRLILP